MGARRVVHVAGADLVAGARAARARGVRWVGRENLTVMARRFEGDRYCTERCFAAFAAALGERFVARVLPASAANPDGPRSSRRWSDARTVWQWPI
jgi:hypothetical protein